MTVQTAVSQDVEEWMALVELVRAHDGPGPGDQISLMEIGAQTVLKKLRMTDVNVLSPIEALNLLAELKQDMNG